MFGYRRLLSNLHGIAGQHGDIMKKLRELESKQDMILLLLLRKNSGLSPKDQNTINEIFNRVSANTERIDAVLGGSQQQKPGEKHG